MTYPELTNISSSILPDMFKYSNSVVGGWFGVGILATLWVILFLNLMYSGRMRAASTSLLVVSIVAVLFRFISILSDTWMFTFIILGIISLLMLLFTKEDL